MWAPSDFCNWVLASWVSLLSPLGIFYPHDIYKLNFLESTAFQFCRLLQTMFLSLICLLPSLPEEYFLLKVIIQDRQDSLYRACLLSPDPQPNFRDLQGFPGKFLQASNWIRGLCSLPATAAPNYHKLRSIKPQKYISLQCGGWKFSIKVGLHSLWGLWEASFFSSSSGHGFFDLWPHHFHLKITFFSVCVSLCLTRSRTHHWIQGPHE